MKSRTSYVSFFLFIISIFGTKLGTFAWMMLKWLFNSSMDVDDNSSLEELLPSTESCPGLIMSPHTSNKESNHNVRSVINKRKMRLRQREVFLCGMQKNICM